MKVKVMQKVKITFLAINLLLFVIQTSSLSHTVAYGKVNRFLTSKVKGQNNIFGHNFGSICHTDFQFVSYCSLWKGQ